MKTYLCGPILGCSDAECKDWRAEAKKRLGDTLDPMRRDYRGVELENDTAIVEADKLDIMACDAFLVNFDKPSVGTSMEILFGWEQHKFVVVVAKPGVPISPWLKYHSDHIVNNFEQAFTILEGEAQIRSMLA